MQDFHNFILPLTDRLYRFAYRLAQNERDAEDLVQDTLLRAYTKFDQFQTGTSPQAWLLVILRSIFINKYRKRKREGSQISIEDMAAGLDRIQPVDYQDLPSTPEDFLFRDVLDSELRNALLKLPQHYQEVIILVDMEELSYREVSDVLGIPQGTVMSRLHRARKTLQSQLQDLAIRKGIIKKKVRALYPQDDAAKSSGVNYGS